MTQISVTDATTAENASNGTPKTFIAAGEPSYASRLSIGNAIAASEVRQNATAKPINPESVTSSVVNAYMVNAISAITTATMIAQLGEWNRSETFATPSGATPSSPH